MVVIKVGMCACQHQNKVLQELSWHVCFFSSEKNTIIWSDCQLLSQAACVWAELQLKALLQAAVEVPGPCVKSGHSDASWAAQRPLPLCWCGTLNILFIEIMGSILTIWNTSIKRKMQIALGADRRRCCYYAGGINDSCARRKSKMGWSEVATLLIGVVWA